MTIAYKLYRPTNMILILITHNGTKFLTGRIRYALSILDTKKSPLSKKKECFGYSHVISIS